MTEKSASFALTRPAFVGQAHLAVGDLDATSAFYRTMLGLKVFEKSASGVLLGAGGRPFLHLTTGRNLRRAPRASTGLFHNAFLVPDRLELARWLKHAAHNGVVLDGASDHLVSEAIYLSDPEGNGIEIYRDRSPAEWTYHADGMVEMTTGRLDLQALYDTAPEEIWQGMADGTGLGHIHLQVSDIPAADTFYRDVLGLKLMSVYPGAHFYATGSYHHHVAANVWNSRRAAPREPDLTGLQDYKLTFNDRAGLEAALAAADRLGVKTAQENGAWSMTDPFGIGVRLSA
ncbi:VOC family protein [Rhizobiaceae bacterium BDR2-2]|uniref:VOC family protein n=1 Tax=Ectorhizobium quercum TaxID=2965071 RepID=A0AAE3N1K3_9HYPH|nr:VOC family protein [Ectorhizobium quercum]MCX8998501.1 VOC family protein [Ectorhizobium quercum]